MLTLLLDELVPLFFRVGNRLERVSRKHVLIDGERQLHLVLEAAILTDE